MLTTCELNFIFSFNMFRRYFNKTVINKDVDTSLQYQWKKLYLNIFLLGWYRIKIYISHTCLADKLLQPSCDVNQCLTDANECEAQESPCDSNQQCENTVGSYLCRCKLGFHLDTVTQACVGKICGLLFTVPFPSHFKLNIFCDVCLICYHMYLKNSLTLYALSFGCLSRQYPSPLTYS